MSAIDESTWLSLETGPDETLRGALERSLKEAIRDGVMREGVALPASRVLAAQLGVSRGVVTDVYAQLEAQGFLHGRARHPPLVAPVARRAPATPRAARDAAVRVRFDFTPTTPDVTLFPARQWAAALAEVTRRAPFATFDYPDPRGAASFRDALADHLGRTRGVVADPARIIACQGAAQAVDLALRTLAAGGARRVAMEDPSLDRQHACARANGFDVIGWPVDGDGVLVAGGEVDAAVVTPAHQFPTGAVLSGERRRDLLAWAARREAFVLEDDYDAEFRYDRAGIRALQGLDPARVIYIGSVSKTLAPALRLGWMVVPDALVDGAALTKRSVDGGSPAIDQLALERLIRTGEYDRAVRRARARYRARRDLLVAELMRALPECPVRGIAAGLHVLLELPAQLDDTAVAAAAVRRGVGVEPLSKYAIGPLRPRPALVVGYGRLPEEQVRPAVCALRAVVVSSLAAPDL